MCLMATVGNQRHRQSVLPTHGFPWPEELAVGAGLVTSAPLVRRHGSTANATVEC
jgi:hypothetical protein